MQQQTAAIPEHRRSQEMDLERLRARKTDMAGPDGSNPAAGAPTTLLSAILRDPGARKYLRRQMGDYGRYRYGPLAKELNLAPEEAEKLARVGGDRTPATGTVRLDSELP